MGWLGWPACSKNGGGKRQRFGLALLSRGLRPEMLDNDVGLSRLTIQKVY
jgi:hypothetical protein